MATYTKTLSANSNYYVAIDIVETSYSIANNTSVISYHAYLVKTSGSGYWSNDARSPYSVSIGGTVVASGNMAYDFRGSTPKTVTIASGTRTITHNADGSGSVAASAYFSDGVNGLGSGTASGTLGLTTLNRLGYISAISSNFIINDGLSVTPTARSNGLTYAIETWNAANNSMLVGRKSVATGASRSITYTAAEQNTLYNYLTSENGTNIVIRLVTLSGSTVLGTDSKTVLCKPKAVSYTAPTSFSVGTGFNITFSPNAGVLSHRYGLVINGSWVTGYPQTANAGVATGAITTATDEQKFAIMAVDTSKNTFTIQIYVRQYNASGVELGLLIKNITANIPNITSSTSAVERILQAQIGVDMSGNITTIDSLAYSLNGGAFVSLTTNPTNKYTHQLAGLTANTQYTLQYRYKQSGTNYYYYSNTLTIRTLAESTLAVSPTSLYVDDNLATTTTKASGVTNRLYYRRLNDNVEIYRNNDQGAGTFNRVFTDADFNDGESFEGLESITVRVYLDMITNGVVEKTITRDVIVFPNGAVYIRENGAWKRAYVQVKNNNVFGRAIPYVRVNNQWQKAKS